MTELRKQKITKIASLACVLHCLIAPIIIIAAPTLGHAFHNPVIEIGIFVTSIIFGVSVIYNGYCNHKKSTQQFYFSLALVFGLQIPLLN